MGAAIGACILGALICLAGPWLIRVLLSWEVVSNKKSFLERTYDFGGMGATAHPHLSYYSSCPCMVEVMVLSTLSAWLALDMGTSFPSGREICGGGRGSASKTNISEFV